MHYVKSKYITIIIHYIFVFCQVEATTPDSTFWIEVTFSLVENWFLFYLINPLVVFGLLSHLWPK